MSIYADATKNALATAAITNLTSAGTSGCTCTIHAANNAVLATVTLTDPPATIVSNKAQVTPTGTVTATGTGTASYARLNKSDNTEVLRLPCVTGGGVEANKFVMGTTSVVAGSSISVSTFFIGSD